jgi:hypothetical protein
MNAAFHLEPDDAGLITVTAAFTPSENIHDPESAYVRYYMTPILGPLSVLSFIHLNSWLTADDATITLHCDEFAHSLGTRPPRLTRSLQRLNAFRLAHTLPDQPATLHVRRRVQTLNPRQLARLAEHCPTLAAHHDQLLHSAA